jgi:predicted secreted protein
MRKIAFPVLVVMALVVACGDDANTPAATTAPTSTDAPVVDVPVSIRVEIGTLEVVGALVSTIDIEGGVITGRGYLGADPAPAVALLADGDAVERLVSGADQQQACTEQYGGPDVAHITGSIDGTPVDTTVDRANGCGIADWDLLQPILPLPLWTGDAGASATYGDAAHPVTRSVGERFTIRLAANATTGYEWQLELPPFLTLAGDEYETTAGDETVGSGGTQVFELEVTAAGDGSVELQYLQPFDESTPPAETRSIAVVSAP